MHPRRTIRDVPVLDALLESTTSRERGTTVYGYDIHAPDGTKIGGVASLRNRTTQAIIDRHRQEHAPTAAAGKIVERITEHYGEPTVIPLGGGAVLARAKGRKTGGLTRYWHVNANGIASPVHEPGDHVPHLARVREARVESDVLGALLG